MNNADIPALEDSNIIQLHSEHETERCYTVKLTEIEMLTLSQAVIKLYECYKEQGKEHPFSKSKTFHLMRVTDRFARELENGKYSMVKKERLPT